ncbi:MAG TPA: helix-turn-helix domain-containing protein [Candidatus Moranbacteria bacterium]|nr:helix-turn-helix domain-containing protein [Candidatus Moranbacteria bacterium]
MNQKIIASIRNLGFSEKESKIYLACLELGAGSIQDIAVKAKVKRTTVYNFVEKLIQLGLVSQSQSGKRKLFIAESPEILEEIQKRNQNTLVESMPGLKKIFESEKFSTNFKYYRGKEGMKKIWLDALESKQKELLWTIAHEATTIILGKQFVEHYIEKVKEKGMHSKILRNYGQKNLHRYYSPETLKATNREARELPMNMKLKNSLLIYGNVVASFAPIEENYSFVIESKSFADTMRAFYEALWTMSKLLG